MKIFIKSHKRKIKYGGIMFKYFVTITLIIVSAQNILFSQSSVKLNRDVLVSHISAIETAI